MNNDPWPASGDQTITDHFTGESLQFWSCISVLVVWLSLADPRGAADVRPPPQQDQILLFLIRFYQKAPMSEVGAPTPQREILDPPLTFQGNMH